MRLFVPCLDAGVRDKNHMEHSACTLYSQDAPTSTWGPNQIFCKIEKNTTPLNAGQAFFALDASNPSNAVTYPGGFQSTPGSAAGSSSTPTNPFLAFFAED